MSTFNGTTMVNINTRFITHEISINGETSLDWTVSIKFLFDSVDTSESASSVRVMCGPRTCSSTHSFASGDFTSSGSIRITSISNDTS
jgi:hypothetical protein